MHTILMGDEMDDLPDAQQLTLLELRGEHIQTRHVQEEMTSSGAVKVTVEGVVICYVLSDGRKEFPATDVAA